MNPTLTILLLIKVAIVIIFIANIFWVKGFSNKIAIFFLLFGFFTLEGASLIFLAPPKHGYVRNTEKACFSNIRLVQGAVEMYNMDFSPAMESLNIDVLKEKGYLKPEYTYKEEKDCELLSEGNLFENGYVYCKKHKTPEIALEEKKQKEKEQNSFSYVIRTAFERGYFITIIYFLVIMGISWMSKKEEVEEEENL